MTEPYPQCSVLTKEGALLIQDCSITYNSDVSSRNLGHIMWPPSILSYVPNWLLSVNGGVLQRRKKIKVANSVCEIPLN